MTQRNGVTLTEVLVAIFVMGIGLLSLLVLFPLGALNMAAAIRDERAAVAAANADAIAHVVFPGQTVTLRDDVSVFPFYNTYTNPYNAQPVTPTLPWGPSLPVYIDPIGVAARTSNIGCLSAAAPGFARVSPSFVTGQPQISRWFTLLDDITFQENGLPDPSTGNVQREGRFTWAYLCRQSRTSTTPPTPSPGVELTIVVYEKRSQAAATMPVGALPGTPAMPTEEYVCSADFVFGTNTATLTWPASNPPPPIRKGGWVLDATTVQAVSAQSPSPIRGYFYRVSGYSDVIVNGATNQMILDLATPVRDQTTGGVAVVMENVIEVFEKGAK